MSCIINTPNEKKNYILGSKEHLKNIVTTYTNNFTFSTIFFEAIPTLPFLDALYF